MRHGRVANSPGKAHVLRGPALYRAHCVPFGPAGLLARPRGNGSFLCRFSAATGYKEHSMRLLSWLVLTVMVCAGCRGSAATSAKSPGSDGRVQVVKVAESQLGSTVEQLVIGAELPNRLGLLAGAVDCQLGRAERLLRDGQEQAGLAALEGAFFLVGGGEFRKEMIQSRSLVLFEAANAAAHAGNEGRALALYSMFDQLPATTPAQSEVKGHLGALAQWRQVIVDRGGLQALGARQRAAVPQVLYRPTLANYQAAKKATLRWMDAARRLEPERRPPPQTYEELDEREEADLARQSGVQTLAVLALRYGDLEGLLNTLEDPSIAPSVRPKFSELLSQAIEDSEPDAWSELLDGIDSLTGERSELGELARAASFRVALALFHSDPESVRSLVPLSGLLIAHGMPDAVPILFSRHGKVEKEPRVLGLALRLTSQALIGLEAVRDLETARLTFANAKPLLDRAVNGPEDTRSSLSMLEHVMGAMEVRAAELGRARPHLAHAARLEPSFEVLRLLGAVDRQQGKGREALESLTRMVKMSANKELALAESQLLRHELLREQKAPVPEVSEALEQALKSALKARAEPSSGAAQSGTERILGRVLEHYGDVAGARRAGVRAIDAARNDPDQLVSAVLDLARRAFTLSDLDGSREALQVAIEEKLHEEDLAYAALWLSLLERQLKLPPGGAAREGLVRAARGKGWPATLSNWALGKLSNDELLRAAQRKPEQAEARFYLALVSRAEGDRNRALAGLQEVATSEAIELVEVTIARDLLNQVEQWNRPAVPIDLSIP